MSRVKVNEVTNKLGVGPVDFPDGITGVALTVTGNVTVGGTIICLLYTSPSPRDLSTSRMPSSA